MRSKLLSAMVAASLALPLAAAAGDNVTYSYAWRINGSYGTGGTGDISINPTDQYQIFQANLNFKF